jgi:hypothetical protein
MLRLFFPSKGDGFFFWFFFCDFCFLVANADFTMCTNEGRINAKELKEAMEALGFEADQSDVEKMIEAVDKGTNLEKHVY